MNNHNIKHSLAAVKPNKCFQITLSLDEDELAAVEGWRVSNNVPSMSDAVRMLVRLGLLSEISKVHGIVSAVRESTR